MQRQGKQILKVTAISASQESIPFTAGKDGRFGLRVRANHGTGTQTLVGTFALKCREDTNTTFATCSAYTFTSAPAAASFDYNERFDGANDAEYAIAFTYTSGTGDITIEIWNE